MYVFSLKTDTRHSGALGNFRRASMPQTNFPTSLQTSQPQLRQMHQQQNGWSCCKKQESSSPHALKKPNSWTFISVVHLLSSPITGFLPWTTKLALAQNPGGSWRFEGLGAAMEGGSERCPPWLAIPSAPSPRLSSASTSTAGRSSGYYCRPPNLIKKGSFTLLLLKQSDYLIRKKNWAIEYLGLVCPPEQRLPGMLL